MQDDDGVNPYPMKGWRASEIVALTLMGVFGVFFIILERNNMDTSDNPIIKQIYSTLSCLWFAVVLSLEGRYLYLHRKWNIQHSVESKILWQIVLCIALASLTWSVALAWLFGLVGPA
jgi:hypothetical protein